MTNLYDANGVIAWEHKEANWPSWLAVSDELFRHYKLTFFPTDGGCISVGLNAEWSDDRPGEKADFTSEVYGAAHIEPTDILAIDDDGLLTVMKRAKSASSVDFRHGFTLQLPTEYVEPVRMVIAKAWTMCEERTKAAREASA